MNEKPIKSFRISTVEANIWRKINEKEGGKTSFVSYNIQIKKNFFNKKKDEWESTAISLSPDELPKLGLVVQKAFEFVATEKSK